MFTDCLHDLELFVFLAEQIGQETIIDAIIKILLIRQGWANGNRIDEKI